MGDLHNIDVTLYYALKDYDGNILAFKEENAAIEKVFQVVKKLRVPENTPEGNYVFYTKISYGDVSASSSENFYVQKETTSFSPLEFLTASLQRSILILVVLIVIVLTVYIIIKRLKRKTNKGNRKKS